MPAIRPFPILLAAWIAAGPAIAQSQADADFHARVTTLYSFEPHKLDKGSIDARSAQLDQFWAAVKADQPHTLPLLRKELMDPAQSAFFYYDGSKLLLSMSQERSDRELALRSIAKADLRGVDHSDYLVTVHRLASAGIDPRAAAFRILDTPGFTAFIPAHALTLGQDYSLICALFPMDEASFEPDLERRLQDEPNLQAQRSLLLALWHVATPTADAAIKRFIADAGKSEAAKAYAQELLAREASSVLTFSFSSEAALREERQKLMRLPISDEALYDFARLTFKLRAKL